MNRQIVRGPNTKTVRGCMTVGNIPISGKELEDVKKRAAASGVPREVTVCYKSGKTKTIVVYPDGRVQA